MEVTAVTHLAVTSPSFKHDAQIPQDYTCEGRDVNPELEIKNIPVGAKTLAVIVEDPDAPGQVFDHWLIWNVPPSHSISEDSVPGIEGTNSAGNIGYMGPCPPSGSHRYFFKIYALDTVLDLKEGADKNTLQEAMQDHLLGYGELMGRYSKTSK